MPGTGPVLGMGIETASGPCCRCHRRIGPPRPRYRAHGHFYIYLNRGKPNDGRKKR